MLVITTLYNLLISKQTDVFISKRDFESLHSILKHQQLSVQRPHKFSNLTLFTFSAGLTD